MKIAITSRDSEISSEVDPRFGRAACFLIYDLEDDSFEFIENEQALNTPSGVQEYKRQGMLSTVR